MEQINATMLKDTFTTINVGLDAGAFVPLGYILYDASYKYSGYHLEIGPRIEDPDKITKLVIGSNVNNINASAYTDAYNFFEYAEITGSHTEYMQPGNQYSGYTVTDYIMHRPTLEYIAIPEGLSIPKNFLPSSLKHIDYQGDQKSWEDMNISIPNGCTVSYNVSIKD